MLSIVSNVKHLDYDVVKDLENVLVCALDYLHQPKKQVRFNVYFVSEKRIQEVNREERNVDRKTDVLSFPTLDIKPNETIDFEKYKLDIDPYNNTLLVGEILICNQVAKRQAKKYGHSYRREVAFLFLHGVLHCLGYDHIEEQDRALMEDVQRKILEKCKITRD